MCTTPYILRTREGKILPVPCGKCLDCRKQYQNEWIFRLTQESKRALFPCFVTLTYNDDNLPIGDGEDGEPQSILVKSDLQKFIKRLRKNGGAKMKDMRYFAIGEYGSKFNRCHYHLIIIAPHIDCVDDVRKLVDKCWKFGFTLTKLANQKSFHYVCKYMNKIDARPHLVKPFRLYSRSIGLNFLTDRMIDYYLTTFDRTCLNGSCRIGLPRYYRRKLDECSKAHPWLHRAGLVYSDLLEDIIPLPGTKYFYFKDFSENFESYLEAATVSVQVMGDAQIVLYQPNRQEVWQWYVNTHKTLKDYVMDGARQLEECLIRNHLKGSHKISYNVDSKILQE